MEQHLQHTKDRIDEIKDINHTSDLPLSELIAEKRIDLALRNIDQDLAELTQKLRKPRDQVQYVADNWRQWRNNAAIGLGLIAFGIAGIVVAKRMMR